MSESGRRTVWLTGARAAQPGDGDLAIPMRELDYTPEPGMTDAEIREDVLSELARQGIHGAEVTVEDGKIEIDVRELRPPD